MGGLFSVGGWLRRWRLPQVETSESQRRRIEAWADGGAWALALGVGVLVRYDTLFGQRVGGYLVAVALAAGTQVVLGRALGLYDGRWRRGSFEEVVVLARAALGAGLVVLVIDVLALRLVPLSVAIAAAPLALVLMGHTRYWLRRTEEQRLRPAAEGTRRVIVLGAGDGGAQVIHAMLRSPASPFVPVALLDDDLAKRRLRIGGLSVCGTRADLQEAVERWQADSVLIAIPSAGAALIQDVCRRAEPLGVDVRVLPPIGELFHRAVGVQDIRAVTPADLLGRSQAQIDIASVAGYLTGKRVLVTGAGGSIGSELCRQVRLLGPATLTMLDRDESALHALQLSLDGQALLDQRDMVVADIRDVRRLHEVFAEHQPQVVFHAAALKHLPLLEMYPGEAVKSNVFGTLNLLRACETWNIERFVNISTDKAADPVSVLGYSKRIAERLTAWAAARATYVPVSVRFGNVLGSRGSVLTSFAEQIRRGGPVTVTHPEVTRYFMTVEEAVQLVIQAGAVGRPGQALVLDMGQPVRIADVARRLISRCDDRVELTFTGLRPGEKLHECLLGQGEPDSRPVHGLITHVDVPPLDPSVLEQLDPAGQVLARTELVRRLHDLACDTVTPSAVVSPSAAASPAAAVQIVEVRDEERRDAGLRTPGHGLQLGPAPS